MDWIIPLLRKFCSYHSRAEALKQDKETLLSDISKAIEAKTAKIERLEQKLGELAALRQSI